MLPLARYCSRVPIRRVLFVPRYYSQITKDDIASMMQDDDKLGLKSLVSIFGKVRNKAARQLEVKKYAEQQNWAPHAFNQAILNYSSSSNTVMASEVLQVMKDIEANEGKKLITVDTYNALLSGYCNAGQMDTAKEVMKEMKEKGMETGYISYALIVNGYANSNQDDNAMEMMREMERMGLQIGDEVIESLVSVFVRKGKLDKAIELLKEHTVKHHLPIPANALATILEGHNKSKESVNDGIKFLKEAKEKGTIIQTRMWNALILNYGKVGAAEQAFNLYKQMEQEGFEPDLYTYNTLIHICDKKNLVEKAFEILEEMKKKKIEPTGETYGSLESLTTRCNRSDLYRQHCGDYFFLQRPPPF